MNIHTYRVRLDMGSGKTTDWGWLLKTQTRPAEGKSCFDFKTALSRRTAFARAFEHFLFVDCYFTPSNSPAFRFVGQSGGKSGLPEFAYFFPNVAGVSPAIRLSVTEGQGGRKVINGEACMIEVRSLEAFGIQLMVAPMTPQRAWSRVMMLKATSRIHLSEPERKKGYRSFGPCEPFGSSEVRRLAVLLHYNHWSNLEDSEKTASSLEHKSACLQEFGEKLKPANIKLLIDGMKIVKLTDGKPETLAEARSKFTENVVNIHSRYRPRPQMWDLPTPRL